MREPPTSSYVSVFDVSIVGGALIGALGIDLLRPLAPMVFGAAFSALAVAAPVGIRGGVTAEVSSR
jgi:predicted MFS family arabinose efflux permease